MIATARRRRTIAVITAAMLLTTLGSTAAFATDDEGTGSATADVCPTTDPWSGHFGTGTESGDWGSITGTASGDDYTVSASIKDGYSVEICVKKGADASDGGTEYFTLVGPVRGEAVVHSDGDAVSHWSYRVIQTTTPPVGTIRVCELATGNIVAVPADQDLDADDYGRVDNPACESIRVCELATGNIISIKRAQGDRALHGGVDNGACETIGVCELATGNIISIKRAQGDRALHGGVDDPACQDETDVASVTVIKEVRGDEGATTVEFDVRVGTRDRNILITLEDGASRSFFPLAGTEDFGIAEQSITEDGWTVLGIACDSDLRGVSFIRAASASVVIDEIGEGENITCTIVNSFTAPTTTTTPTTTTPTTLATTTTTTEAVLGTTVTTMPIEVLGTTVTTMPVEVLGTTVSEVSADTLPFTGFAAGGTALLAMLALLAGGLTLFAVRGRKQEEGAVTDIGGWSNL